MVDIKEIKSIEIVPYTLITSSVSAVWAFIYAIFTVILGLIPFAISPTVANSAVLWFYIASIVSSPVSSFVIGVLQSFLFALFYNLLVPKIGGIKLGLEDLSEIKSVPVVPFALITSTISAIFVLIITLIIMPLVAAYIPSVVQALSSLPLNTTLNTTIPVSDLSALQTFGIAGSVISIIILPIVTFIVVFIIDAILAALYNLLAPRVGGIKLDFAAGAENMYEILSVAPVQLALITAVIVAVIAIIVGIIATIISAIYGSAIFGVGLLVGLTVGGFIGSFIVYAILALIYNFLRPKIGGIKLELQ